MYAQRVIGVKRDGTWAVPKIKVLREKKLMRWSPRWLIGGLTEGWLEWSGDRITLKGTPPLVYNIVGKPGYYCCHDNRFFDQERALCKAYTETIFKGVPSPDPNNPLGWRLDNHFTCELATRRRINGG